jgi:hypothetical protein
MRPSLAAFCCLTAAAPLAAQGLSYRGFAAGATYADFAARARALQAAPERPLVCRTARLTAQLMECAVPIRDPADSAAFQLAAHLVEGRVALVSFGDSGGVALVQRMQADLQSRFGAPTAIAHGTWEWRDGRRFVRLNWRGRGEVRWLYLSLVDLDVMDRISRYARRDSASPR